MKKYGLRILVGLIAFGIGVSVVIWEYSQPINCSFVPNETKQTELPVFSIPSESKLRIEVHFREFKKTKDGLIAVVKVKNNSTNSVYFEVVEDNKSPNPFFKFNDIIVEKSGLICGYSSMNSKQLRSGESREFKTLANYFEEYFDKSGNLRIGYSFGLSKNKESQIYWSEEILIPAWVKDEIDKEKLENSKEWRDLNSSLIPHPSINTP